MLLQFFLLNFHVDAILLLQKISGLLHFLLIIFQAVAILVLIYRLAYLLKTYPNKNVLLSEFLVLLIAAAHQIKYF